MSKLDAVADALECAKQDCNALKRRMDALTEKEQRSLEQAKGDRAHFRDLVNKTKGTKNEAHWRSIYEEHDEEVKRLEAKRDGRINL